MTVVIMTVSENESCGKILLTRDFGIEIIETGMAMNRAVMGYCWLDLR